MALSHRARSVTRLLWRAESCVLQARSIWGRGYAGDAGTAPVCFASSLLRSLAPPTGGLSSLTLPVAATRPPARSARREPGVCIDMRRHGQSAVGLKLSQPGTAARGTTPSASSATLRPFGCCPGLDAVPVGANGPRRADQDKPQHE